MKKKNSTRFKKGQSPWNKGIPHSEEAKKKMRLSKIKAGIVPPSRKGLKATVETRNKMKMNRRRGPLNNKWKGGISPLNHLIRNCYEYRQWRSDVFTRDNYTCVFCGAKNGNGKTIRLEADHYPKMYYIIREENDIKTLEDAINCQEFWNINNGRTLCAECHNKTKPGVPKKK